MRTVVLKPPNISDIQYDKNGNVNQDKGSIKSSLVCLRPSYKLQTPFIKTEFKNGKIISHNYGHSGDGFSILFGCVEKSIEEFQKLRLELGFSYFDEITVIGLGCMGLVTALTLYFRGFRKIKIIGEKHENIPSTNAGGLFEISLSNKTKLDSEEFREMNNYFLLTFYTYREIAKGHHKYIKYGIREVDFYTDFYQTNFGLSYLANIGEINKPEKVRVIFENNKEQRDGLDNSFILNHFNTFHINTTVFMQSLLYTVQKLHIQIEKRKVTSFQDIDTKLIFNCTGLGSKELNKDQSVYPTTGHGIILRDEENAKNNYIFRLREIPQLEGTPYNGSFYFMPKVTGFIGGTYIPNYYGDSEEINTDNFNIITARAKFIFNGIKPLQAKLMNPKF
jgi:D-amino-acid oxidase